MGCLARGLGETKTAPQTTVASKQIRQHALCFVSPSVLSPLAGGHALHTPHPSLQWPQPVDQQGEPVRVTLKAGQIQGWLQRLASGEPSQGPKESSHRQPLSPPAPVVPHCSPPPTPREGPRHCKSTHCVKLQASPLLLCSTLMS